MKVSLYNQKAEEKGSVEINDRIFGVKPSLHLLAEAVRIQDSNARKGLAHTKTKGEVSGGGKKPWRQKGTGRARAGSIRSPLWRGGGITFGPRSKRNWNLKINKKAKRKALFMALSDKVTENQLIALESIALKEVKTKLFLQVLEAFAKKIKDFGRKTLVVIPQANADLQTASRNIPNITMVLADSLNVKDVLIADNVLVLQDSFPIIESVYLKESAKTDPKPAKKAPAKKVAKPAKGGSAAGRKVAKKVAKKTAVATK